MANSSIMPAVIQAEQPSKARIATDARALDVSDFAITVASMPLPQLAAFAHDAAENRRAAMNQVPRDDRRQFIRMSLAAAGMAAAAGAGAAEDSVTDSPSKPAPARSAYLVIYRPGPSWQRGALIRELPLRDHGRYMLELYRQGALRFAGPFADDSGGAVMLEVENDAAARALVEADPAVTSRIFRFQLHRWTLAPWAEIAQRQSSNG